MSYSVIFRYPAERDGQRAQDWYAFNAPEQAERFLNDLAATVAHIRRSPKASRNLRDDARRAALKVFPYLVWYRCHEELEVVEYSPSYMNDTPAQSPGLIPPMDVELLLEAGLNDAVLCVVSEDGAVRA